MRFEPIHVVVNPAAGRGGVADRWPAARAVLDEAKVAFDVTETAGPGEATAAARGAVEAGARLVVAVGGDGTIHEVVNGMMGEKEPHSAEAALGVVAAGTGSDFARTFGMQTDPAAAARRLLDDRLWGRIDVARLRYQVPDGEAVRWFANIGEAGLGAEVVALAARMPGWLGASVYRIAALRSLARHRPSEFTLRMHGRKARARPTTTLEEITVSQRGSMVVFANCQFFGGGMRVAPRAVPSDGLLDVLVFSGPKTEAMRTMPKMFKGTHIPSKQIAEYLASGFTLEADPPMALEADGEVLGRTPCEVTLLPAALPLKI